MAITISNIEECSIPITTDYFTTLPSYISDTRLLFSTLGIDLFDKCTSSGSWYTMLETDIMRVDAYCADKSEWNGCMNSIRFIDKRIGPSSIAYSAGINNLRHCYLALGFDDDTQTAYWLLAGQFYYRDGSWSEISITYKGAFPSNIRQQMYELISGSQIPIFNWQSLSSISGKLGTFNLSTIKDEFINDGNAISGASASNFNSLETSTKLSTLLSNYIYTDWVNYVSISDTGNDTCELKFYLNYSCIYTLSEVSTNAYFSMLVDEELEVAKPSIIYENNGSYSYNQEEPTDTEMENLYKWLTANNNTPEFWGFCEKVDNSEWIEDAPYEER